MKAMVTPKKISIDESGNCELSGDINLKTVTGIYAESLLLLKGKEKAVINFAQVASFDSAIISLMLSWIRDARKQAGRQIVFKNVPEKLHYLIEAYKLTFLIDEDKVRP